jgi:hypothetical protein
MKMYPEEIRGEISLLALPPSITLKPSIGKIKPTASLKVNLGKCDFNGKSRNSTEDK